MSFLRSDLPLSRDPSGRFLPWIIGVMVYLAALTLAATMALDEVVSRWQIGLTGSLTVQIPPESGQDRGARIDDVLDLLAGTPDIASLEVLSDEDVTRLLEPWLGSDTDLAELPLPDLIAVELRSGASADLPALQRQLATVAPGATIDDHGRWLDDLVTIARSIELLAAAILALVGTAAVITVVFATRTGLSIHRRVIELVHLIGARDAYIARQFEAHALRLGLAGGALGVVLAILTLLGLGRILDDLEAPLLLPVSLRAWHWLVLGLLPVAAAGVAMLTARLTVLRSLSRIL